MSVEEQLAIFLYTIDHNERNQAIENRFLYFGKTISWVFNNVLMAILT